MLLSRKSGLTALVPAAAAVAVLAGCGGSGSSDAQLTTGAFRSASAAICRDMTAQQAASGQLTDTTLMSDAADILTASSSVITAGNAKLRALSGPADVEAIRDRFVDDNE